MGVCLVVIGLPRSAPIPGRLPPGNLGSLRKPLLPQLTPRHEQATIELAHDVGIPAGFLDHRFT